MCVHQIWDRSLIVGMYFQCIKMPAVKEDSAHYNTSNFAVGGGMMMCVYNLVEWKVCN